MANEEFFDIVDENNEPLNLKKSRKEVHDTMRYWHRVTHIWIVNDNGSILCQERSLSKDANPGKWQSFFGGHLKAGQTYFDNALEELSEELGLFVEPKELTAVHILKSDKAKHFGQVFTLHWNGGVKDLHFKDNEVASVQWMTLDEIRTKMKEGLFCNNIDPEVEKLIDERGQTQRGINRKPLKFLARFGQKISYLASTFISKLS